ncbi:hypothetical protein NDI49_15155 [Trichocoleus sp. ST-U3]|uniref:hypothetical protein n=1 Tax=Coleofasciculus sp. FACHB-542 TaxID=2692787 RepID=UPI001682B80E|nr:hypothetical protein [Coleofasciculus sp. FACHB-542]MBD2084586.1 hypothetical protein [Coleofasciculus sp. FACHB-542]
MKKKFFDPERVAFLGIGFSVYIFCIAYTLGQDSRKLTELQKLIYPVLFTIGGTWGAYIFKYVNDVNAKIESEIKSESNQEAERKASLYLANWVKNINNFKSMLKPLENSIGTKKYQDIMTSLDEVNITYEQYLQKRQAADHIVNWLQKEENFVLFVQNIVDETKKQYPIEDRLLKLFYGDISGCVKWLMDSVFNMEKNPIDFKDYSMKQALNSGLPDAIEIYRFAINLIEKRGRLKELSGNTSLLNEYLNYLKEQVYK